MKQYQAFRLTKNLSVKNNPNNFIAISLLYDITRIINIILGCNRVWSTYTVYQNKSVTNFSEYLNVLIAKLKDRQFTSEIIFQDVGVAYLSITFLPTKLVNVLELDILKALNSIYSRLPTGKYFVYHTVFRESNMGVEDFGEHIKSITDSLKESQYSVKLEKSDSTYACLLIKWEHPVFNLPEGV